MGSNKISAKEQIIKFKDEIINGIVNIATIK